MEGEGEGEEGGGGGGGGGGRGRRGNKVCTCTPIHTYSHTACTHAHTASSLQESTNLECIETGMSFQPLPI